jgi:hypothetical protein
MIAITVVISMVIILFMMDFAAPKEKPVFASFNVRAINDTIIEIRETGGNALLRSSVSVVVNGIDYHDSGLRDMNHNDYWDKDEIMYIEGLDLRNSVSPTISSGNYLVLTMNVPRTLFVSLIPVATIPPTPPPPLPPAPCPTPVVTPSPATFASGRLRPTIITLTGPARSLR